MSSFYIHPSIKLGFSLPSDPASHPINDSLKDQPFTNLLDIITSTNFSKDYRTRAVSVLKTLRLKILERQGGREEAVASMDAMIARRIADSPAFAKIYGES